MEALERFTLTQDWITLLILAVFLMLVIARNAFPQRFLDFSMLFATNKYLLLRGREPKVVDPFNLILFLINIIMVSLFIFIFYRNYSPEISRPEVLYLQIATAYTSFILLKFSLEKIIANILNLDEKMEYYMFYKLTYRNFLALLFIPINLSFIYIWKPGLWGFIISVGIILLLNFLILAAIYNKNHQYILANWFYFILYLCALEIGPYYILYKLITRG